jgi:hypothetical protein
MSDRAVGALFGIVPLAITARLIEEVAEPKKSLESPGTKQTQEFRGFRGMRLV